MGQRFFSDKARPVHLGGYPPERLARVSRLPDPDKVAPMRPIGFHRPGHPESIVNAMGEYQAMLDAIRVGLVNRARAEIQRDPLERSNHLKSFGYFSDTAMVGGCEPRCAARLNEPVKNPDIDRLAEDLRTRQTKTPASGIDVIMADLKDSMEARRAISTAIPTPSCSSMKTPARRAPVSRGVTGSRMPMPSAAVC